MIRSAVLAALLSPSLALAAGNYAECILDRMPGVANEPATTAVVKACKEKHPGGLEAVSQGSGRGLFAYKNGSECLIKVGAKTPGQRAAWIIGSACRKLYDEANFFDQFDPPTQPR